MNFLFNKNLIKMNYFTLILLVFVIIYLLILLSTYIFQRNLLYHPRENNYSGDKLIVPIKKVKIKTQDNIELFSWYYGENLNNNKTILFLNGNGFNYSSKRVSVIPFLFFLLKKFFSSSDLMDNKNFKSTY